MTSTAFRSALARLQMTQRAFAAYCGSDERTVRRWAKGDQDIPRWVPVMVGLMERGRVPMVVNAYPDLSDRELVELAEIVRMKP